jgi:restriction endonuclease S subunit
MTGKVTMEARLGDIAEFINGGAWNQNEYSTEGIPVVRVTNLKDDGVDLSDCKFLPPEALAKYSKHILHHGDLIIATVGSHPSQPGSVVGRPCIAPRKVDGALLNQNAVLIRTATQAVDQRWLGYLGRSPPFRNYVISCARGSANQVRMAIGLLKEMPVTVPPIEVQRRIASILLAYDDLIEVNSQRMALLEEMARRLFEEWFVRFRFPGHNDSAMVDTPEGPIPQGWSIAQLSEVLATLEAGSRPKGGIKDGDGDVPSIGAENINGLGHYDFGKERLIPRPFFSAMRRGVVQNGDVLLYKDGAHIGRKAMFRDGYPYVECAVNEHVFILRPRLPVTPHYLYFWLDQPQITAKIKGA